MKTQDDELERDPFQCTCGPCKKFWKSTFSSNASSVLRRPPSCRASDTAILAGKCQHISVGTRVTVQNKHTGAVKYVGFLENNKVAPKIYVGIKLDDNVNSVHNGVYNGKRYFHCPRGHGSMVKFTEVQALPPPNKKPMVNGNYMFPSYNEIKRGRKLRAESLSSVYSSCSGGSTTAQRRQSTEDSGRKTPLRTTNDRRDMIYKDKQRQLEMDRRRFQQPIKVQETEQMGPSQAKLAKWKQDFGGDERAARMAETLQKLHLAYEEGRKLREQDDPDETESERVTKLSFKS